MVTEHDTAPATLSDDIAPEADPEEPVIEVSGVSVPHLESFDEVADAIQSEVR
jgi:hypothetical protein